MLEQGIQNTQSSSFTKENSTRPKDFQAGDGASTAAAIDGNLRPDSAKAAPLMAHWAEHGQIATKETVDQKEGGDDGSVSSFGSFTAQPYEEHDSKPGQDENKNCGVAINLKFHPNEDLLSDKISFLQIMKCTKGDKTPLLFENEKPRATKAEDQDAGWTVDRLAGKDSPNYGENNDGTGGNTHFGYRKSKSDFSDATMYDRVNLPRQKGQTFACEATTFALDNTNSKYLGGVRWGYKVDQTGTVQKNAIKLESTGNPGGVQKQALKRWNEQAANKDVSQRNSPNQKTVPVPE